MRFAFDLMLLAGLWFMPPAVVFAGVLLAGAVFHWYGEALLIGFLASAIAGLPSWKLVFVFGCAVGSVEMLKFLFRPRRWFSYPPLVAAVAGIFAVLFFIVL